MEEIFFYPLEHVGASSFSVVTVMSKISIYPLLSTTNLCNDGQNFAIPLLKKRIIRTLSETIKT